MAGRRRQSGGGGHDSGQERWLLTYADMITLLLALFIVLFAMSTINAKQFDNVRRSLSQTFKGEVLNQPGDVLNGSSGVMNPTAANQSPDNSIVSLREEASNATAKAYADEQEKFKEIVKQNGLKQDVAVEPSERGFVISIAGDALFASGSSELRPDAQKKLTEIGRELIAFGRQIEVQGHTDGQPFPQPGGNWKLSGDRALSVVLLLAQLGMDPRDMAYTGKGEYFPKVKPKRQTDSVARNRRIEIVVLAPGVDDKDMPANKQEVTKLRTTTSKAEKSVAAPVPGAREALDAEIQGSFADAVVSTSQ